MKLIIVFLLLSFYSFTQEPNEKYCKKILTDIDKFEGDTTYRSPHKTGFIDPLYYIKSNGLIMMYINVPGSTVNIGEKGVIILLKDGTKIEKPNVSIDCEANVSGAPGFVYSALFVLSPKEIESLSKSPVSSVRLYIYDSDLNERRQVKQMEYLRCLREL